MPVLNFTSLCRLGTGERIFKGGIRHPFTLARVSPCPEYSVRPCLPPPGQCSTEGLWVRMRMQHAQQSICGSQGLHRAGIGGECSGQAQKQCSPSVSIPTCLGVYLGYFRVYFATRHLFPISMRRPSPFCALTHTRVPAINPLPDLKFRACLPRQRSPAPPIPRSQAFHRFFSSKES
jgi:hypothetical protein